MFSIKSVFYSFFLAFLTLNFEVLASHKVPVFSITNLAEARKVASEQGKIVLVDFCASWCKPCQWMEKTTYKDEKVRETLSSDFITVKIDIDEAEGFELKKIYDVKFLPTILVFSPHGDLIDRIEQALSPHKFIDLVLSYKDSDGGKGQHALNKSPKEEISRGSNYLPQNVYNTLSNNDNEQKQSRPSYKVQVGTFTSYEVAEDMVKNLRKFFVEPITVIYDYEQNVPVFKVRIGQFGDKNSANFFKGLIKDEYNMDGFVI